jgi:hypothetical protein
MAFKAAEELHVEPKNRPGALAAMLGAIEEGGAGPAHSAGSEREGRAASCSVRAVRRRRRRRSRSMGLLVPSAGRKRKKLAKALA